MILNQLEIRDFGVFKDTHTIDLTPRTKNGRKHPIVLFGGLNGAGKTTTLTAVRLALYGRLSMGRNLAQQAYHQQLIDLIHKPSNPTVSPFSAEVKLSFTYGKHGVLNKYQILRSWEQKNGKVTEYLEVLKDGERIPRTNSEQLQSFLNELIPIGVADLFFFDGEKIADLAEDSTNEALADAINRLLGLDIIDRLRADLGIFLRDKTKLKMPEEIATELKVYEAVYKRNYSAYEEGINEIENINTQLISVTKEITSVSQRLNDLGGAWAKSREMEELKVEQLIKEKQILISEIKELYSDSIPLTMAPKSLNRLLNNLAAEKNTKAKKVARTQLNQHLATLKTQLTNKLVQLDESALDEAINTSFIDILETTSDTEIVHDISETDFERIQQLLSHYLPLQKKQLKKLNTRVEAIEDELSIAATNIARAPDTSRLNDVLAELGELQKQQGGFEAQLESGQESTRKFLRDAMDNLRRIRDLDDKYSKSKSHGQGVELADNTRKMLVEFGDKTKARKLAILEQEFIKSFSKLARKDDMEIQAHIDASTFNVSLTDRHGKLINKKQLSAGEKQIYAIAMLEALGRTSGRNLPIIIDTPLGRLDSKHRTKIVKNYFPTASHQVLILSTDTEIDEDFYTNLSPEISHAFSVEYNTKEGCSEFKEGYFWQNTAEVEEYVTQ